MEKWNFDVMHGWRVYLLYCMACTIVLSGCVLCLNEEGQLLLKWKQDYLEDPDNSMSNWNASDTTPCFWNGVKCTQGSVSALDMSPIAFCNLVGDIHALTFANFANLTTLNVGNTSLNGNFPEDIVICSKLVYLNLSWTFIGGEVPANLNNLQQLQVLDLTNAYFEGTVETRFDEFQELRVLRLAWNQFEGQIPESIPLLTKLEELTLSGNNWNGTLPLGFFTIPNLKVLWLGSDLDVLNTGPWPKVSLWEGLEDLRLEGINFPQAFFPTGILKLTKLRTLHLERCKIMGPIPSLESLTHLEDLDLANNTLTGHIPDMFGSMPNLTVLTLYQNQLSGSFPASLWQCKRLSALLAFNNGLNGDLAGLANLRGSLTWLDLTANNFSGEIPASLTLLTYLNLGSNNFTREIPPSLGNLSLLTSLLLDLNNFTGGIPPSLGNLSLLTHLDLGYNRLSGEIPASLGNLTLLTILFLGNNNLTGQIPPSLGNLSHLTYLALHVNNLSGKIPSEFANWEGLSQLSLFQNQLSGEIPYDLGRNSLLELVDLTNNRLEGHVPPYLCWGNNVTLQYLSLSGNRLTGTIPETYGNCTNLGVVRFDGNQLEGPVPAGLWGGANLVRMQLSGNNLSGSIDSSIGKAKSLSILYLQDNVFSGPIPAEIGQTSLVEFQANSNEFNGTLTPLLGNLSSLTDLTLGGNSFSGAIPASLGSCTELVQLDLSNNHLDGAIPDELADLSKLSTLDVSENNLTGTIPGGLFNMLNLQTLNVAFNNLSGVIPNQGNSPKFVSVNFTGNPYLCVEGSCGTNSSAVGLASKGVRIRAWIVVLGVFGGVAVVLSAVLVLVFRSCWSEWCELGDSSEDEWSWTLTSFHNKVYHEDEVTALDEDNVLGAGGSGKVYKVTLSDGEIVAVKKLWNMKKDEGSRDHGFGTELKTLANIRHRHIVKLLCSCAKRDSNLLVYEYMPNGSLGDLLHGPQADTLPWEIRYKIAVGAATGLEYLHHDCSPQILHRDIKSNNILVDLEYEANLADFGIARMVEPAASHDLSSVAGSVGYIPPEYSFGTRVTEKIDIYSFGVVLLELVTGRCATDSLEGVEGSNLVQWVQNKMVLPEGLCEILDSKCETSSQCEMIQVLKIAMSCTSYMPASRPSMREVVKLLGDMAPKLGMKVDSCKDGECEELQFEIVVPLVNLSRNPQVVDAMLETIKKYALCALVERMVVDDPYHTMYQMKRLVESYIKLAELETKKELEVYPTLDAC